MVTRSREDNKIATEKYAMQIQVVPHGKKAEKLIKQPVEFLQVDTFSARGFDFESAEEQKRFETNLKEYRKHNKY